MPYVLPKVTSYQYTGADGAAYVSQFANVTLISEAAGVLTVDVEDAGTMRFTVQTNGWMIANYASNAAGQSWTNAEYIDQYVEV